MNIVTIGVASREAGERVMDRVDAAVEEGKITIEDLALVYKTDSGKVKLQQTADATAGKGALKGGALGLLVGLFSAPLVPAVAVGAGIGALVGKARDRGVSDDLMKQIGLMIEGSEAVVFVLADEASAATIGAMVDEAVAGGADVDHAVLPKEAEDFVREALKLAADS
ncbi:MAG: DUF1269 domain-containing protein [Ilumatobacteraceae bacterium]